MVGICVNSVDIYRLDYVSVVVILWFCLAVCCVINCFVLRLGLRLGWFVCDLLRWCFGVLLLAYLLFEVDFLLNVVVLIACGCLVCVRYSALVVVCGVCFTVLLGLLFVVGVGFALAVLVGLDLFVFV